MKLNQRTKVRFINCSMHIVKNQFFHINKYRININTKKCDEKIGFISCGFYDNIDIEICVKKDSMKCPYRFNTKI